MKRKAFLLLLCFFLSGCYVQSLNKFYTDDLKVDLPQISGKWLSTMQMGEDVSDKKISPWSFTEDKIETYDKNDAFSELEVVYFKVGDSFFMDFTAGIPLKGSKEIGNIFWGAGVTPTHSLCKLAIDNRVLIIIPMNFEWIEKQIKEKRLKLSFVKADKDSNYIFTAPTKQWVSFLKTHSDDKNVFDEKYRFVLKKTGQL